MLLFRQLRSLGWIVPFACIGFTVLSLLRPVPQLQSSTPKTGRVVMDGSGMPVVIEEPFLGSALTWGPGLFADAYLEISSSPDTLVRARIFDSSRRHFSRQIMSRVFPEVLSREQTWQGGFTKGPLLHIEQELAYNSGVYLANIYGPMRLLQQVGLPVVEISGKGIKNYDETLFVRTRIISDLLEQTEHGEAIVAQYKKAYKILEDELDTQHLSDNPRILIMGSPIKFRGSFYIKSLRNSYQIYLPPAGVKNAAENWTGEQQDTERILAMDPEYIFLMAGGGDNTQQTPEEFMRDPRWQGLQAVKTRRVYRMFGTNGGGLLGLILQPISVRWMAEIVHPDRLKPRVRDVMRETYLREFNYFLTDAEIDAELHLDVNQGSSGYVRFIRNVPMQNESTVASPFNLKASSHD
jgi:hypothetical protein